MAGKGGVVLSASVGTNDDTFADLMRLHVPPGSVGADVTYGRGCFWKKVPNSVYTMHASDLKTGVDFRNLPYKAESLDFVVLDPPYAEGFFRRKKGKPALSGHSDFFDRYSDTKVHGGNSGGSSFSYHQAVLDLYFAGMKEATRVLKPKGVLILKCQDEVSCHRQHLTHVQLINHAQENGYYCKDLFVVVRRDTPRPSPNMSRQQHARKNHSYFLVMVKDKSCQK